MTIERITELLAIDYKLRELQAQRDAIAEEIRESPDLRRLLEVLGVGDVARRASSGPEEECEVEVVYDASEELEEDDEGGEATGGDDEERPAYEPEPDSYGGRVMRYLRSAGALGLPRDIADATGVPRARMGATLSRLRDRGLVRRVRTGEWEAVV